MNLAKFTILGSGSGIPQADRATSGYLLTVDGRHSLIDCGGGVTSSFLRRGLNPAQVDRVFVSHTHSDHVAELSLFLQRILHSGRTEPFHFYLPSEFVEPFKTWLNAVYLLQEKFPFEFVIEGYDEGFHYEGDFTLTAHENSHLKHNMELIERLGLPNKCQCFSFDMGVGEKRLFYSSDIKSFDEIRDYLPGCAYVVMEATHIDLDVFTAWAPTADVGRFVITHLGTPDEVTELSRTLRAAGLENFVLAVDGLELPL